MKVKNLKIFSERLKATRVARRMTQLELAQEIAVSLDSVKKWERGIVNINGLNLKKLSDVLGVSQEYLAGYDDVGPITEEIEVVSIVNGDNSTFNLDGLKKYVSRLMDNNNLSGKKRIVVGHALAIIEMTLKEKEE